MTQALRSNSRPTRGHLATMVALLAIAISVIALLVALDDGGSAPEAEPSPPEARFGCEELPEAEQRDPAAATGAPVYDAPGGNRVGWMEYDEYALVVARCGDDWVEAHVDTIRPEPVYIEEDALAP